MGFGVNAALREDVTEYQLSHITSIQLLPSTVPPEKLREMKEAFRLWIEGCGFRELVETFGAYVDAVYRTCFYFRWVKRRLPAADLKAAQTAIRSASFPRKLEMLKTEFVIEPQATNCLLSINRARNCLAHRRGIVAQVDLHGQNALEVSWLGPDSFVETPSGAQVPLNEIPSEGIVFPEGGVVAFRFVARKHEFRLREVVSFSTRELAEICWYFEREARSIMRGVVEAAKKEGVPVEERAGPSATQGSGKAAPIEVTKPGDVTA